MPAKGCHQSEEAKAKIAAAHRGMKRTPEQIAKHAAAIRGRTKGPLPQETRDKISAAQRGRKQTPEQIEKNRIGHLGQPSARKGATLSEETKQKIRDARAKQIHPQFAKKGITPEMVVEATANGFKWCMGQCKAFLPLAEFYGNGKSKVRVCIKCSSLNNTKVYGELSPEEKAQRAQDSLNWRLANPDQIREKWIWRKYRVTQEWYKATLEEQGGHCALCPATIDDRKPCKHHRIKVRPYLLIDHDHEKAALGLPCVRGILCAKCNTALHRVEYVTDWAMKALAYLTKHGSDQKEKSNAHQSEAFAWHDPGLPADSGVI